MKTTKKIIAVMLGILTALMIPTQAFAATFGGKTYIKELVLSYGDTEEEAKNWLSGKGYKIYDCNINEGADDTFSTERAVYIGYKTTSNADEAITDMKLMNMNGGYSVQDYQLMLEEQKTNIRTFLSNFKTAVNEYRSNYKKGLSRAVAAHDMLNILFDDDTQQNMGDLLLEKTREEYSDADFKALSDDEQDKVADMTTILMQSNATSILAIEQLIALSAGDSDTPWTERYADAPTYFDMVEGIMDKENLDVSKAMTKLASKYDSDAKAIASKIEDYREYLKVYTDQSVSFSSTEAELEAFRKEQGDVNLSVWYTAGTQYETLKALKDSDDITLLEILTDDSYDIEGEDRYLLYPLVSLLSSGQKACLDFLPLYQIISLGINGDNALKDAMEVLSLDSKAEGSVSIYDGIDRSIFGEEVALTGEAYKLEQSSEKDYSTNWISDGISDSTKVLYIILGVSVVATVGTFVTEGIFNSISISAAKEFAETSEMIMANAEAEFTEYLVDATEEEMMTVLGENETLLTRTQEETFAAIGTSRYWKDVFHYVGLGMTAVSLIIMGITLWKTYEDLKAYYNVEFTPIPMHMVNQGVNENNEKVFTYYKAVNCNRQEAGMVTDSNKILKGYGDINGDVGKQWVALYTTKDKAAGKPITTDFIVQYSNTDIPGESTPLSMFCESTAQNLTNKKGGFTYADDKNGIYLFYSADSTAYAASAVSGGIYAVMAGGSLIVCGLVTYIISKRKKVKEGESK